MGGCGGWTVLGCFKISQNPRQQVLQPRRRYVRVMASAGARPGSGKRSSSRRAAGYAVVAAAAAGSGVSLDIGDHRRTSWTPPLGDPLSLSQLQLSRIPALSFLTPPLPPSPPRVLQFYEKWFGLTLINKKDYSDFSL